MIKILAMKRVLLVSIISLLVWLPVNGQNCQPATAFTTLEVNNVRAGLMNGGDFWWDLNSAKYEVPKGGGVHALFSGCLWMGGVDANGELRVAAQMYRQQGEDYWPGPLGIDDAATEPVCLAYDRFWHVKLTDIQDFDQQAQQYIPVYDSIPLNKIPTSILEWPASGNPYAKGAGNVSLNIPVSKSLAPYVDVDGKPGYNPTRGDYPKIRGEETVWWVFNDAGNVHSLSGGEPLNIEVKAMAYAVNSVAYLQEVTFYNLEVTNYGYDLDSTYLGLFVDADLGYAFDDFVGCDTTRDLGICYNGDSEDGPATASYGQDPPMVGVDILRGPLDENGKRLGMESFLYFDNDFSNYGNPEYPIHFYQYLMPKWKDGTPLVHQGMPVRHIWPGDPSEIFEWSECSEGNTPFDRRMVLGSGPFSFRESETKTIDFSVVWSECTRDPGCPSFDCIQTLDDVVQTWFDSFYPPVGVDKNRKPELATMNIEPNPAKRNVRISWNQSLQVHGLIQLLDLQGRIVYENVIARGETDVRLSLTGFDPGMYLIQLSNSEGISHTGKLMVHR